MRETKPYTIENTTGGKCDCCGKDLGARKWILWDNTGCTKKCVETITRVQDAEDDEIFA